MKHFFFSRLALVAMILTGLVFSGCQSNSQEEEEPLTHTKYLILLELTASDCGMCAEIHRLLQDIEPEYEDKVEFVTFNLSSTAEKIKALETSRAFNAQVFVKRFQDRPGTVALLSAMNGSRIAMVENNTDRQAYRTMIETALKQVPRQ